MRRPGQTAGRGAAGASLHCLPQLQFTLGKKQQFSFSTEHSGKLVQLYMIINDLNLVIVERKS